MLYHVVYHLGYGGSYLHSFGFNRFPSHLPSHYKIIYKPFFLRMALSILFITDNPLTTISTKLNINLTIAWGSVLTETLKLLLCLAVILTWPKKNNKLSFSLGNYSISQYNFLSPIQSFALLYNNIIFYNYLCLSVCMSFMFRWNAIFSAPNWDKVISFFVHISLIYDHLFYKYFVRRSVDQAKKVRNVKI